nr:pilus assembly protein TadG-related protein [Sphingomicrobium astaxanthinifaciens]
MIHRSDGAAAPTIALSLFALVGAGGIAFDYARMASLDTELQNAADQAALAAASQLDGKADSCARGAQAAARLVANETRMANDGDAAGFIVEVLEASYDCDGPSQAANEALKIRFWQDRGKTIPATGGGVDAKFVEVEVETRRAIFALTPVVAALGSGDLRGVAFAGINEAVCKVPPLMICNPNEGNPSPSTDFEVEDFIGFGLRLKAVDPGGAEAPGNYGFLKTFGNGTPGLKAALGYNTPGGDCLDGDEVTTEPGNKESVTAAINTRFDIFVNGQLNQIGCASGFPCNASTNSVKDLVLKGPGNQCGVVPTGNPNGWREITDANQRYYPVNNPTSPKHYLNYTHTPAAMGHPRDKCHAVNNLGICTYQGGAQTIWGDGYWDIDAYFRANHPTKIAGYPGYLAAVAADPTLQNEIIAASPTGSMPTDPNTGLARLYPTRYMVYRWEMGNGISQASGGTANMPAQKAVGSNNWYARPKCDASGGIAGGYDSSGGVDDDVLDRRLVTVAVLNCQADGVAGRSTVPVVAWIDVFMVEPSFSRAGNTRSEYGDLYVEIVSGAAAGQQEEIQLVKKAIPYLIE